MRYWKKQEDTGRNRKTQEETEEKNRRKKTGRDRMKQEET